MAGVVQVRLLLSAFRKTLSNMTLKGATIALASFFWFGFGGKASAQSNGDSLLYYARVMATDTFFYKTQEANYDLIRVLGRSLRNGDRYGGTTIDSLKRYIGIVETPDKRLAIYTWHLELPSATYRHFGVVTTWSKKGQLEGFYPLRDQSDEQGQVTDTTLAANQWHGAIYFGIAVQKRKGKPSYTLLGADNYERFSDIRILDELHFEKGKPVFGAPIFSQKKGPPLYRRYFEYAGDARMLLRYSVGEGGIVMDHLAAPSPRNEGLYFTYMPDLSYDRYRWKKGVWLLEENVILTNEE